MHSRPICN